MNSVVVLLVQTGAKTGWLGPAGCYINHSRSPEPVDLSRSVKVFKEDRQIVAGEGPEEKLLRWPASADGN
jgi:hypothetical protein